MHAWGRVKRAGVAMGVAGLVACVVAPAADAGTMLYFAYPPPGAVVHAQYRAASGERNDVTIQRPPGKLVLRDKGNLVVPGTVDCCGLLDPRPAIEFYLSALTNCTFVVDYVSCRVPGEGSMNLLVMLGERDDRALVTDTSAFVDGGAGNDALTAAAPEWTFSTLRGGAGNDNLQGAAGHETLFGDAGQDTVSGGAGDDRLELADGEVDQFRCGVGTDIVIADVFDVPLDGSCEIFQ